MKLYHCLERRETLSSQWKNETYENFIHSFKKCFTWNAIQNSFILKKTIFLWKSVSLFLIDFTSVFPIPQKSKVTNKSIMIFGCSNDILFWLTGWFSLQDLAGSTNRVWLIASRVPSEKFKKTEYLKLMLQQVKLQWQKCWRKQKRW